MTKSLGHLRSSHVSVMWLQSYPSDPLLTVSNDQGKRREWGEEGGRRGEGEEEEKKEEEEQEEEGEEDEKEKEEEESEE